ncbi:heme exporter protein CcmD [Afifella sp. IM 167]|uniref:heme exporter protein CcmD n=1 Tax=Afifella sp. IM 167 TaxID=2033586 RepID=UPI001CCF1C5E|nr:heme exporter protein CcmD [Afifella sp. IM 167]MBZ8132797.1 heme exporter protein CcmD [Afifella sp. IM 167]
MTHLPFIIAAYGATALVITGLVVWVSLDVRVQKRRLEELEKAGPRRQRQQRRHGIQA